MAYLLKPGRIIFTVVGNEPVKGREKRTSVKEVLFSRDEFNLNLHDGMIYGKWGSAYPSCPKDNGVIQLTPPTQGTDTSVNEGHSSMEVTPPLTLRGGLFLPLNTGR